MARFMLVLGFLFINAQCLAEASHGEYKPGGDASAASAKGDGQVREKLVIFNCQPPNAESAVQSFSKIYDTREVSMPLDSSEAEVIRIVRQTIRTHKPRAIAVFCHGEVTKKKYELVVRDAKNKEAYRVDGEKFRKAIAEEIERAKVQQPIFFANTCQSGGIALGFDKEKPVLPNEGAICAACPADKNIMGGNLLPNRLRRVYEDCASFDLNRDGEISAAELKKAFTDKIGPAVKKEKEELEEKLKKDLGFYSKEKEKQEQAKRTLSLVKILEGNSHFGCPLLYGSDNTKVFSCPVVTGRAKDRGPFSPFQAGTAK